MTPDLKKGFDVGPWHVEPLRGEMTGPGGARHLEPKAMDVLVCLAQRSGELLTRDELLQAVWGARAVSDEPLTRAIGSLRRALGDSSDAPTYIETVPKRGYRLLQQAVSSKPVPIALLRPRVLALAVVVLIGFLGYREFSDSDQAGRGGNTTLAADPITVIVLPFSDISPAGDQDFLAQGVSVELAKILVTVPGLSIVQSKSKDFDPATLGTRVAPTYVLDGDVQKAGRNVQITAQLISAQDGVLTWAQQYQQAFDVENLFDIQNKIAVAIATAVAVPLDLDTGETLADAPTGDTEAYQLYLRALVDYRQRNLVAAADALVAVVAMEPLFAQAWALLAQVHSAYPAFLPGWDDYTISEQILYIRRSLTILKHAADRAYSLDPEDVDVLAALAGSRSNHDTFAVAEDTYLRALEKDPNNSELLEDYAQFLRTVGRLDDALDVAKKLVEINPLPFYQSLLGAALQMAGDNHGAIAHWESGAVDPNYSWLTTAHRLLTYFEAGRYEDARAALAGFPPGRTNPQQLENMDQILGALAAGTAPPDVDTSKNEVLFDLMWPQLGASQAFLDIYRQRLVVAGWKGMAMNLAYPLVSPARSTTGYKELVTELGLVDYWRERGWPDYCHPAGENDFECE